MVRFRSSFLVSTSEFYFGSFGSGSIPTFAKQNILAMMQSPAVTAGAANGMQVRYVCGQ